MRGSKNRQIITIVVGILAVAVVAFLAIGLIFQDSWPGQLLQGTAGGGTQPAYGGGITVDGNSGEWVSADYFADMYRAGNPSKPVEAKLSLRYDCGQGIMYALVLSAGDWPVETAGGTSEAWIQINGSKVTLTQFAWVDQGYDGNSGHAKGWEAAFTQQQGDFTIEAHTNTFNGGESQTSKTTSVGISIICSSPTAVELVSFTAEWASEGEQSAESKATGVILRWETASEIDNLGFNVFRGTSEKGPWTQLNKQMIPSLVPPGSPKGATYEWNDLDAKEGGSFFYLLEDVDTSGVKTQHGPVHP
jgi:hypothetical protein